eukprot:6207148-Pleurochrysis_carterae.AAC.1
MYSQSHDRAGSPRATVCVGRITPASELATLFLAFDNFAFDLALIHPACTQGQKIESINSIVLILGSANLPLLSPLPFPLPQSASV